MTSSRSYHPFSTLITALWPRKLAESLLSSEIVQANNSTQLGNDLVLINLPDYRLSHMNKSNGEKLNTF